MGTTTAETGRTDPQQTVGDIVTQNPSTARVLERHGIDYCCQGATTLQLACATKGISLDRVLADLNVAPAEAHGLDLKTVPLAELTHHIVSVHHDHLRTDIPRMKHLFEKVVMAHGEREPRVIQARDIFVPLADDLLVHMNKEEQILFPWIRSIEGGTSFGPPMNAVGGPIACMMQEHAEAGTALAELKRLTDNHTPPAHACPTWHALYAALAEFEEDMHRHVHKENSVLFPRAMKLAGVEEQDIGMGSACSSLH